MKEELEKAVTECAKRAAAALDSNDALKFTQAAVNAANALAQITQTNT